MYHYHMCGEIVWISKDGRAIFIRGFEPSGVCPDCRAVIRREECTPIGEAIPAERPERRQLLAA